MAFCGWESADGGLRVLIPAALVRELRMLAIEGFVAVPKRGMEVGGVLFGEVHGASIQIEGWEEAPCEHRYGPSYALSATDRARLSEVLAGRSASSAAPVIGFFRSFTARDPVIEAADEEFVREHFPRGDFLFLMLQPLSAENCVAGFRFFRDGVLLPEPENPPFTFDPALMPPMEPEPAEPPPEPPSVLPAPYRGRAQDRAGPQTAEHRAYAPPRRAPWWFPVAICLVAGVGGAFIYELWRLAREPRWAELHLDARPVGSQVEVTWDASAPATANATRALLAVNDGGARRDIELTPQQIRAGKYSYAPSRPDQGLRLIVYGKGLGVAGDAMRVTTIPGAGAPAAAPGGQADRADAIPPASPPSESAAARVAFPPSTVHEVQPAIPEGIRSRIREQIVIPVEVQVNTQGRVTAATVNTDGGDGVRRYLAEQAQRAARLWRFTPAKSRSGTRVAANKTIHFVFTP